MSATGSSPTRTKALQSAPSLLPLYIRSALTAPLHRGGTSLPGSVYELPGQRIDAEHLAGYQRVCGFRVSDALPPTYLHVLAFPVSVALMNEPGFPFALVGLVHVANAITAWRPVQAQEIVDFTIRAEQLRDHPSGRQFDIVVHASSGGETIWDSRSTYLRRGGAAGRREGRETRPATATGAEQQPGTYAQLRVPEGIGRQYAAVSGDRNPIHLHALAARAFGFPKAIAHGMWLEARTLATLEGRLADAAAVDVAFKTPVLLPSTIDIAAAAREGGWDLSVRNARSGKPHLTGSVREPASRPGASESS